MHKKIFIRWDMDANSWQGNIKMLSIHETLDGAVSEVPDSIKTPSLEREPDEYYVKNYTFEAIEERELLP